MNKDVIYIDVDDDVTAIIGKIKKAKEKVVALVPPKRAGALQSTVNLRLIDRMVKADKKHLVLITNNQALIALAANASIPVAKNLQSKPELAEIPALAVDDGDDIIDGSELPVGDHAKTVKVSDNTREKTEARSDVIDDMDIDGEAVATSAASIGVAGAVSKKVAQARSKVKIPNFDKFRKRLFLGIGGGVLLIALLVWMFVFAPAATILVTAKTSPAPVSATVKLGGAAATDFKTGVVKSVSQQEKKDESVEFEATGQEDVGNKATGTIKVSKLSQSDQAVPAGSRFTTTSGLVFVTQTAITVPASVPCFPSFCAQSVDVAVTADKAGTDYNGISGASTGPSGTTGTFNSPTSGGTTKIAKVVSADDIERAKGQLIGKPTDEEKKALTKKFTNGEKVIDSSFTVERAEAVSTPSVNAEAANGKAKLTIATTYTLYAVPKADLESFLSSSVKTQLDNENSQRVYNTGIDKANLSNFKKDGDTLTATVTATGQIGPKIDEAAIKELVKGEIYGEVQSTLEAIDGVQEVDVKFSYFWVRTVPNDTNKIHIEFKLEDEN
ncbi:MAG: hypothetical protein WAV04_01595 [Candidatus Microsaccharimonas sp.]